MKRKRPDPLLLAIWIATHLEFDQRAEWQARHLWNHWLDYLGDDRASAGTPRSFSSALRRLGAPWRRGFSFADCGIHQPRTRVHRGVRLRLPRLGMEVPLQAMIDRADRYGM